MPPEKRSGKGWTQLSVPSIPGRELCTTMKTGGAVFAQGVEEAEDQRRREGLACGGEGREYGCGGEWDLQWDPMLTPSKGIGIISCQVWVRQRMERS